MEIENNQMEDPDLPEDTKTDVELDTTTPKVDSNELQRRQSFLDELTNSLQHLADQPTIDSPEVKAFIKNLDQLHSKFVYVLTVFSLIGLHHIILDQQWLLPYYYTVVTPVLLLRRLIAYWKMHYQYFLLDFCYFGNVLFYIYIWAMPENAEIFAILFSAANGPLLWSLFIFRNSLVFHSLDKVTSVYIHLLPSLLSFVIRWYPEETSRHWYKKFTQKDLGLSVTYLFGGSFALAFIHLMFYSILVQLILSPSAKYNTVFRHLSSKETTLMFKLINICGPRYRYLCFCFWSLITYALLMALTLIWYKFFYAHLSIMCVFISICLYNGATYYMDVFRIEKESQRRSQCHAEIGKVLQDRSSVHSKESIRGGPRVSYESYDRGSRSSSRRGSRSSSRQGSRASSRRGSKVSSQRGSLEGGSGMPASGAEPVVLSLEGGSETQ